MAIALIIGLILVYKCYTKKKYYEYQNPSSTNVGSQTNLNKDPNFGSEPHLGARNIDHEPALGSTDRIEKRLSLRNQDEYNPENYLNNGKNRN